MSAELLLKQNSVSHPGKRKILNCRRLRRALRTRYLPKSLTYPT